MRVFRLQRKGFSPFWGWLWHKKWPEYRDIRPFRWVLILAGSNAPQPLMHRHHFRGGRLLQAIPLPRRLVLVGE
jgi:hypothetical protein